MTVLFARCQIHADVRVGLLVGLLGLCACAKTRWYVEEKPLGASVQEQAAPLHEGSAWVVDEPGERVIVEVNATAVPQIRHTQTFKKYKSGQYTPESAKEAATTWLIAGGISASVVGLIAGAALGETDENGDLQLDGAATGVGFLVTAVPFAVGAGVQIGSPLLPARRKDVKREERSWIESGTPVAGSGLPVSIKTSGPRPVELASGVTDDSGAARLPFELPQADEVLVRIGELRPRAVDLRGTPAWIRQQRWAIRALVGEESVESLEEARSRIAAQPEYARDLWSVYCDAFDMEWGARELEVRTLAFAGRPDLDRCDAEWREIDAEWGARLAPLTLVDPVEWPPEIDVLVQLARPRLTPEVEGLRECVALRQDSDPEAALARIDGLLGSASDLVVPCLEAARDVAVKRVALLEEERERGRVRCEQARQRITAVMPALVTTRFADTLGSGVRRTRDAMVSRMNSMVRKGGPDREDEQWVDCVKYALMDADDMMRGVYQMNRGGYAHEWIEEGRFAYEQEGILRGVARPGEACGDWVRGKMGTSALAPIDRYVSALDDLEASCRRH